MKHSAANNEPLSDAARLSWSDSHTPNWLTEVLFLYMRIYTGGNNKTLQALYLWHACEVELVNYVSKPMVKTRTASFTADFCSHMGNVCPVVTAVEWWDRLIGGTEETGCNRPWFPDYQGVTWIWHKSPSLPCGSANLPDKIEFWTFIQLICNI